MQFKHRLTEDDRQRLVSGGPLNPIEQQIVQYLVNNYFIWLTDDRNSFHLEWSKEWPDGLHVHGQPHEGWDGEAYFPGERVRQFVLQFLGDPDLPEPDASIPWQPAVADEDWMLEDTWVVGKQPEKKTARP